MIELKILSRLRRGPANEAMLARWCDLPRREKVRPFVCALLRRRAIFRAPGDRYALGRIAGPVVIRGYRWFEPVLEEL